MAKLNVVVPYEVYEKVAEKYREVKRPAKVGELIKIVEGSLFSDYQNGDIFEVIGTAGADGVNVLDRVGDEEVVWHSEYVVLEPIQPKRLSVGDYARVIADQSTSDRDPISNGARVGDVVEVLKYDGSTVPYLVKTVEGAIVGDENWAREWALEYVDKAEFLAQQNRLKVGDFVKVVDANNRCGSSRSDVSIGEIRIITEADGSIVPFRTTLINGGNPAWFRAEALVRATEAEVEAAKAAAQREAKQALKYGDFNDGDYAEIVNATPDNACSTAIRNAGKFVKVEREPADNYRGLKVTLDDGDWGYANADALRKVTREEYEAAVDPRNQFAKGDKVRIVSGAGERFLLGYKNGDIVEIRSGADKDGDYSLSSPRDGVTPGNAKADQLEKVSVEETAEFERKQAEEKRWAEIGREVGEFKPGDLIKVKRNSVAAGVISGEFGEVREVDAGVLRDGVRLTKLNPQGIHAWVGYDDIELIVPVEQRFDREEAA